MSDKVPVIAKAPGKIFWCGEHAVVYGSPAVLTAIEPGVTVQLQWTEKSGYWLDDPSAVLGTYYLSEKQLQMLAAKLAFYYDEFLAGKRAISDLLDNSGSKSCQLVAYHLATLLKQRPDLRRAAGIKLHWIWRLEPGCGMGGSASLLWGVTRALVGEKSWSWRDYYQYLVDSENLQHGHSSGLDIAAQAMGDTFIYRRDGELGWQAQNTLLEEFPFHLVYTGTPISSTGECVMHVARRFEKNHSLLAQGKQIVTSAVDAALSGKYALFIDALELNQLWLEEIGVVPDKIKSFREAVATRGGVFKLSGAGAIRGDQGGVGLLIDKSGLGTSGWQDLIDSFGYRLLPFTVNKAGVQLVQG